MKHRGQPRRHRTLLAICLAFVLVAVLGVPFLGRRSDSSPGTVARAAAIAPAAAPSSVPTRRARPRYLTHSYRAPTSLVKPAAGGTLLIPSLGIRAPVDAVGLDGTAMAVPNDVARVGWLISTAHPGDVVGASVLAGHVSDARDRPGVLNRLDRIKVGATIWWADRSGRRFRFRVVRTRLFVRSRGLPEELFSSDGPRQLNLVTCAARVTTANGGFHYTSNLVVTAVRTPRTGRGPTG